MAKRAFVISIVVALAAAVPALAVSYTEIVSWSTLIGPSGGPTQHYGSVVDGQTSYHQLALNAAPRIVRVSNLNGAQAMTTLVSTQQWVNAGGTDGLLSFYGFSLSGDYIQFTDTSTDAMWRVHKNTGAITPYVTNAQIAAAVGAAGAASLNSVADTTPDGELAVFETSTKNLVKSSGQGNVSIWLSGSALETIQGAGIKDMNTGLSFDSSGAMYWGNNTTDTIYKRAADGTLSVVITAAQLYAGMGVSAIGMNKDLFIGPDGYCYFNDNTTKNIVRFSLANPAATVTNYITGAELTAGPAAGNNVGQLTWYDGRLAFNILGTKGLYAAVPEPATLILLAAGALGLRRR